MTIKKHIARVALPLILLLAAFAACQRRPLEYISSLSVRVIVKCIWEVKAYPEGERPTGMTMYFFKDGEFYNSVTTSNVDSCEVMLEKGHYSMYMISQSTQEYGSMEFKDMDEFSKARSILEPGAAEWATRGPDEIVVQDPEVLLAGVAEEFDITDEMAVEYQTTYKQWTDKKRQITENGGTSEDELEIQALEDEVQYLTVRIPVYPTNVVSQFWVTIYVGSADMLQSMRASISGMARTFDLTLDVTDVEQATQVIRYWSLDMDDQPRHVGHVDGIITTFGLPDGQTPSTLRDSTLNVSALLVDNKTVAEYVFNVGDKIVELEPNPGFRKLYRLIFGSKGEPAIVLPEVIPVESGGGFTANVADWEDEIEAEIQL